MPELSLFNTLIQNWYTLCTEEKMRPRNSSVYLYETDEQNDVHTFGTHYHK